MDISADFDKWADMIKILLRFEDLFNLHKETHILFSIVSLSP
jgi:hypothetical protein